MLLPILLFTLVLCGALTVGLALTVARRKRRELEQRLGLLPMAMPSAEPETPSGRSEKPKPPSFG